MTRFFFIFYFLFFFVLMNNYFIIALMLSFVNGRAYHSSQIIYKPGSVPGTFACSPSLAIYLAPALPPGSSGSYNTPSTGRLYEDAFPCSRQGLPLPHVTMRDCGLLPHSFHPYLFNAEASLGGIVSVALSLGSLPAAVSGCRSLRCPDFPPPQKAAVVSR